MFPVSGQGTIETNKLLLAEVEPDEYFQFHDALFPHAERNLQYQLYTVLSEHGTVTPEFRTDNPGGAIDLVWNDTENRRRVGIEVKTHARLRQQNVTEQIERYQNFTLDQLLDRDRILVDGESRPASRFHVFDAVWIATFRRPRPKGNTQQNIDDLSSELGRVDGWLEYDSFTGEIEFRIDSLDRNTLYKRSIDRGVELAEPEAPLGAILWKGLVEEGFAVAGESSFSPSVNTRSVENTVTYAERSQADLVAAESRTQIEENEPAVVAIEVKADFEREDAQRYIQQLERYIDSKMFSRVYLAVPCSMVPSSVLPTTKSDSSSTDDIALDPEEIGIGVTTKAPLSKITDELPELGVISVHHDSFHQSSNDSTCDYDRFYVLQDDDYQPTELTTQRVPYILYNPHRGYAWDWRDTVL